MHRARRLASSFLCLAALTGAPPELSDRVDLPLPPALLALPALFQYRAARLSVSPTESAIHLFDVRAIDPEGRFTLTAPYVEATLDGRITIHGGALAIASAARLAPQRSDAWTALQSVRDLLAEAAALLPPPYLRSIAMPDLAIDADGERWSVGAHLDLTRHGTRWYAAIDLGSAAPGTDLFLDLGDRDCTLSARLDGALFGGHLISGNGVLRGDIIDFDLSVDGTRIDGSSDLGAAEPTVEAHLAQTDLAWLMRHWPSETAATARRWVARHIRRGTIESAAFHTRAGDSAVDFAFSNTDADVPRVRAPIRRARGRGRLTADRLTVAVARARVGELDARSGSISLMGLRRGRGRLDVEARLFGPAAAALRLHPHPPLAPERVSGSADLRLAISIPYQRRRLDTDALALDVRGRTEDIAIDGRLFERYRVSRGDFAVRGDRDRFELDGRADVEGVAVELVWTSPDGLRVRGVLDQAARRALGIAEIRGLDGPVGFEVSAIVNRRTMRAHGTLDLGDASLSLPLLGWTKPERAAAQARFTAETKPSGALVVSAYALQAPDLTARGALEIDRDGEIISLRAHIDSGENRFDVNRRADHTVIFGESFDARAVLAGSGDPSRGGDLSRGDRTLHVDLDRVVVGKGLAMHHVVGVLELDRGEIRTAGGTARLGRSSVTVHAKHLGRLRGHTVDARITDAGELARALGLDSSLAGGRARVTGTLAPDRAFEGRVRLRDFRIDRPSAALSALSATSISGIDDLIRGRGLHFHRADARISIAGDTLAIREAHTSGGPFGLSVNGQVDLHTGRAHLTARVAPLDDVNRLVRKIPLLGKLLAPDGDGLLVAPSYSVDGELDRARIELDPASLLPAFLRRLFE